MTTPYMTSDLPAAPDVRGARPTGVAILAVLNFVGAGLAALGAIAAVAFGAFFGGLFGGGVGSFFGAGAEGAASGAAAGTFIGVLVAFGFLVGGLIAVAMGFGLWKGMAWAWFVELVFAGLTGLNNLYALVQGEFEALLGLGIAAFLIWYFLQPGVKRWFGRA
jgi:hypothetical protein